MINLLILVIDCLGLDRYEGEHKTALTPNLDALRSRSQYFANSHAVGSNTNSVMGACFTGLYPLNNHIRWFFDRELDANIPTLASRLSDSGYTTAATVTDALVKATDLLRGFDSVERREKMQEKIYDSYGERVKQQIADFNAGQQPWFYFVHTAELHQPRQCHSDFRHARYGETFFDRGISCIDHYLGPIFAEIDFENTMVVVMGDHGDNLLWEPAGHLSSFVCSALRSDVSRIPGLSKLRDYFFEKGMYSTSKRMLRSNFLFHHDYHVYRFLTSSPVLMCIPGKTDAQRIEEPISTVDLMPTILDCLALPAQAQCDGVSLCPLMRDEAQQRSVRPIFQEVLTSFVLRKREPGLRKEPLMESVIEYPWKLVICPMDAATCPELYHLEKDPDEYENLYHQHAGTELVTRLKNHLNRLHSKTEQQLTYQAQAASEA